MCWFFLRNVLTREQVSDEQMYVKATNKYLLIVQVWVGKDRT